MSDVRSVGYDMQIPDLEEDNKPIIIRPMSLERFNLDLGLCQV